MTAASGFHKISDTEKAAVDWFFRLKEDAAPTPDDWRAFWSWLKANPEHEEIYRQYEFLWDELQAFEKSPEFIRYALEESAERRAPRFSLQHVKVAVASLAISVALLALPWLYSRSESYGTAIGEQRTFSLEDGSQITLDTNSLVDVRMKPWERLITLQRGAAFFTLAHNSWRPFWVHVGSGEVRAVGTRFGIRDDAGSVTVALLEGSIVVSTQSSTDIKMPYSSQRLVPGQIVRFSADGLQTKAEFGDVGSETSWRLGRLSFSNVRLGDVVVELNKYSPVPIRIVDPDLADKRVSAYFQVGHTREFLTMISQIMNVTEVQEREGILLAPSTGVARKK